MVTFKRNRRLDAPEARHEGVLSLRNELKLAVDASDVLMRLGSYPSDEEEKKALEELRFIERRLQAALSSVGDIRRNLK